MNSGGAYAGPEMREEGGAQAYLTKPEDVTTLAEKVEELLGD